MIAEAMWIVIAFAFVFAVGYTIGSIRAESRLRDTLIEKGSIAQLEQNRQRKPKGE